MFSLKRNTLNNNYYYYKTKKKKKKKKEEEEEDKNNNIMINPVAEISNLQRTYLYFIQSN